MINDFFYVKILNCRLTCFIISQTEALGTSALVVEAVQFEWPLNIVVSIPVFEKPSFKHLETVNEVNALWGFTKRTKIWDFWVLHDSRFDK